MLASSQPIGYSEIVGLEFLVFNPDRQNLRPTFIAVQQAITRLQISSISGINAHWTLLSFRLTLHKTSRRMYQYYSSPSTFAGKYNKLINSIG